jgi:hypothetical protein
MSEWTERVLAGKANSRRKLADLPFKEKVAILEKLRDRSRLFAQSRLRTEPAPAKSKQVQHEK